MDTQGHLRVANIVRLIAVIALIAFASYWLGARVGTRGPLQVTALANPAQAAQTSKSADTAGLGDVEARNVRIYRQSSAAVANIITKAVEYDFFQDAVPVEGAGSGFVIDPRGYVMTNNHVIEGADTIAVTLGDRSRYAATLVGTDPRGDIALLKIDPKGKAIAALPLGDSSNLQVGQAVLAIGNPFGFSGTLTTGIVSALGRTVQTSDTSYIDQAIQTDAAINRGNSGGPLLNSRGEVIGVNTAIYSPSGATAGIGFAIPINTAKRIANDLMTHGRVRRAYLGITTIALWPALAQALQLPVQEGLMIERIAAGGPGVKAGLRGGDRVMMAGLQRMVVGGDVIVAADGKDVANQLDLGVILDEKLPGQTVRFTLYRAGRKMDVTVTLGEE